MNTADTDPRFQQGKHLTLVNDSHLAYIGNIPRHIIPAYAAWTEIVGEATDLIERGDLPADLEDRVEAVAMYLDESWRRTVSVNARGRSDLTAAIRGLEEDRIHRDSGTAAFDATRRATPVEEGKSRARRGLKP